MSSLAQEESRWISVNVTWGKRKRFADGKVSMPYKRFPGYERGEDGSPKINESEAVIVRRIYRLLMKVKTTSTRSFFCLIFFVIPHRLHRLLRSNHPSLAIACNFALSSTNIRWIWTFGEPTDESGLKKTILFARPIPRLTAIKKEWT